MDAVDGELERGGGPYFMGAELSLVECVFAPMLERIAASIPYYKGLAVRGTRCAARHPGLLYGLQPYHGAHTLLQGPGQACSLQPPAAKQSAVLDACSPEKHALCWKR